MQENTLITSIEIYKLYSPLTQPFIISLGPIYNAQNIIVVIRSSSGCSGYGECSPYATINGETIDTCFTVAQYLANVLKGKNALDIQAAHEIMDKTIYANTSIKSAFDMALYDIASQTAGLPLYRFLGGNKNKELVTDMTVSIDEPKKMQSDAVKFKEQGFTAIKVKLGENKQIDVTRIKMIREGIGDALPLRIDANQGWSTTNGAIEILKALSKYKIEHCEEPIPRWRFMELSKVSAASPIPIMADETCGDHHDAQRLVDLKACPMFNIKLGKSSGLFKALKIVEIGAKVNIIMQIGGFMESRIGMTASAHLALTNDAIHHCDFDTPLMFTEDPVKGGIVYKEKGIIEVPETPGLGAVVSETFLKKAQKIII